ncbi:MAG: hypothetical protein K2X84_00800 [Beijerinckiaceae bacterium]|nr:hypothetical protein [Beijerinckiaceae bacterium]
MSFQQLLDEDRRLCVLRCLWEADGRSLNEDLLLRMVGFYRLGVISADDLRGYMTWLEGQRLVTLEKLPVPSGVLWVATLTGTGVAVAEGKRWPGIAQPAAR